MLCFLFLFCGENPCVGGRCSNCFFGTQKKKMQKKKKNKWLSSLGRLSLWEAFFAKSFLVPVFATPPFIPSFSVKHFFSLCCCCCCFFWGGKPFYTKTRVLHKETKYHSRPVSHRLSLARSLARSRTQL